MKVGLVGNPNVGKSTIFNALTGSNQHTGNWPGKTVSRLAGYKIYNGKRFDFVDLPGTYSLNCHSKEEEVTRDFIFFDEYDALVVICDASSLERNLNLAINVLEVTSKVILVVNLMDEARKKGVIVDCDKLSKHLGVPVIEAVARDNIGIDNLLGSLYDMSFLKNKTINIEYELIGEKLCELEEYIPFSKIDRKVVAIHLLLNDYSFINSFDYKYGFDLMRNSIVKDKVYFIQSELYKNGITLDLLESIVMENISFRCESICLDVTKYNRQSFDKKDRIMDSIFTGKYTGIITMIGLLFIVFWITIVGANYPSDFLYYVFDKFENVLINCFNFIHLPSIITDAFVYGVYRVLSWVVAVMLPPMAIFFPLFMLLEDFGYLPRIAFCLDGLYQKCLSCGKQALTMIEGFGCNAVGVSGARIIDSERERLISIITNAFIPCNGRFPLLVSMISMFLISNSFIGAGILTLFILIGIFMTFIVSKILSKTLLKGVASSFILELPPYRRPQIGKTLIRSIFDRTSFVLKRAIKVSAPAGLIIWLMANIQIGELSILKICANFLNPFGMLIGLDGIILMAFILGFPANEIVIPIMVMGYMSASHITDISNLEGLKNLLISNGWSFKTAICMMFFSILHFPCLTTLLTIKSETGSNKWTFLSFLIPLLVGIVVCLIINVILIAF